MKFKIGDQVRKIKGYKFEGVIISGGVKLTGDRILYSVEIESELAFGWCKNCQKDVRIPIEFNCEKCGLPQELIRVKQNCGGMVHIFAEQDIELI